MRPKAPAGSESAPNSDATTQSVAAATRPEQKASPKPTETKKVTIGRHQMAYICDECGALFPRDIGDEDAMDMEMGGMAGIDCPKCGKKKCAYMAVRCPACKKYYVPESHRQMAKMMENPEDAPPPEDVRDICPHCKTDRIQWYREHRRRR